MEMPVMGQFIKEGAPEKAALEKYKGNISLRIKTRPPVLVACLCDFILSAPPFSHLYYMEINLVHSKVY